MFIYLPSVSQFSKNLLIENQAKIKKEIDRINKIMYRNIFKLQDKYRHICFHSRDIESYSDCF